MRLVERGSPLNKYLRPLLSVKPELRLHVRPLDRRNRQRITPVQISRVSRRLP